MVKLIVPILLIAFGLLSDVYIYHRYFSRLASRWRWAWWFPMAIVVGFFVKFLFFNEGLIAEYNTTNLFLLTMCIFIIPKMLFTFFAWIPKVGQYIGLAFAIAIIYIILYGITLGFNKMTVREVVYESKDVPEAFDGYRIAMFSDAHTGVFRGPYEDLLQESMDSINAHHPDLICFVGDIENFSPTEIEHHQKAYSSLHAPDGVITVMGNHDYSSYIKASPSEQTKLIAETRQAERSFGWDMLENSHRIIHRGNDSIVIIGEENWGLPPFPQFGDMKKATAGVTISPDGMADSTMSIMLSHDPTAWKKHILPVFSPNITLSGHTHGTQFSLFGWSPASMKYSEWGGEYRTTATHQNADGNTTLHDCLLCVSTGIGGNFPFRFNMPREAVIITLKHKK